MNQPPSASRLRRLRRIEPGDDITSLAAKLNQSPECVREALAHDIRCVSDLLAQCGKVVEIVKLRPEWTEDFVHLARRQVFGRRARKARRIAGSYYDDMDGGHAHTRKGNAKPWKDFSQGRSTARRTERQKKIDVFATQTAQLERMEEAMSPHDLAHLGDGVVLPGTNDLLLDEMSEGITL